MRKYGLHFVPAFWIVFRVIWSGFEKANQTDQGRKNTAEKLKCLHKIFKIHLFLVLFIKYILVHLKKYNILRLCQE